MIRIFHTHIRLFLWLLFAGAVLVQIIGLYQPSYSSNPPPFAHADKVAHIMMFGAVAVTGRWVGIPAHYLFGVLILHAGASEIIQEQFIPGRGGDIFDAVADLAGIILGWVGAGLVTRWVRAVQSRQKFDADRT